MKKHFTRLNFSLLIRALRRSVFNRSVKNLSSQLKLEQQANWQLVALCERLKLTFLSRLFGAQKKKHNENGAEKMFQFFYIFSFLAAIELSRALSRFQLNRSEDKKKRRKMCRAKICFGENGNERKLFTLKRFFPPRCWFFVVVKLRKLKRRSDKHISHWIEVVMSVWTGLLDWKCLVRACFKMSCLKTL